MIEAGIHSGDVLVVDKSLKGCHGDVVAAVDGEFTVKTLSTRTHLSLIPANAAYAPLVFAEGAELQIFGVVTGVVRILSRKT